MSGLTEIPVVKPAARDPWAGIRNFFRPAPPAAVMLNDPKEIVRAYRSWRTLVMVVAMLGYTAFYFVRKNLGIAIPVMHDKLGISNQNLGIFLTLHGLLYGISRFANGFLADRSNARAVMVTGLVITALLNIAFGMNTSVIALGIFWMLNGWFQGMGFPPCARLMTHWFPPKKLATRMSLWNTSHGIGAGVVVIAAGYLAKADWRYCFFVPAGVVLLCAVVVWMTLPDTPPSVGLPEVEGTESAGAQAEGSFSDFLMENVFLNKYIWLISFANFLVYVVRYAVLDWGATLLTKSKGIQLEHAGWIVGSFEFAGVAGMLLGGWITDRVFGGRPARTCTFCMAFCGLALFAFWRLPAASIWVSATLLCTAGFFVYGPQALIGIMAANLGTKRAASTAAGLTGLFGYASTILSGWGLGKLADLKNWNLVYMLLIGVSFAGALFFAAAWPAKAHGYKEKYPV